MKGHTNHKVVVGAGGAPEAVIVPYDDYVAAFGPIIPGLDIVPDDSVDTGGDRKGIPHDVVRRSVIDGVPIIRAWREYLDMTQEEVAERAGISQAAYSKMENREGGHRSATLKKIADALGIDVELIG